jgi:hypothetical protein
LALAGIELQSIAGLGPDFLTNKEPPTKLLVIDEHLFWNTV